MRKMRKFSLLIKGLKIWLLDKFFSRRNAFEFVRLKKFHNIHKGKRCFVIGNGLSLNELDLSKLKSEITIGSNRIYLTRKIVPKYYCIEDELMLKNIFKDLERWRADDTVKFIPRLLSEYTQKIRNVYLVNFIYEDYKNRKPNFSEDFSKVCYWGSTVTYMMLQLAYYLGCNPIYMIGMDGVRKHRHKHFYKEDYIPENPPVYSSSDPALKKAKEFFEDKGIKIFNATKNPVKKFFREKEYKKIFL